MGSFKRGFEVLTAKPCQPFHQTPPQPFPIPNPSPTPPQPFPNPFPTALSNPPEAKAKFKKRLKEKNPLTYRSVQIDYRQRLFWGE